MRKPFRLLAPLLLAFSLASTALAGSQPASPLQEDKGFIAYTQFGASSNADGQVYRLDSSIGYNFSQRLGVDVGMPFYFVQASGANGMSENGLGNPYLDVRLKFLNPLINYGSVLTGYAPVGDSKLGLSTGRATFDWTNHFDRSFSRLTPFGEIGIANSVADSALFIRPYTTLGFNTHLQGGATLDIWKFFQVGASAYDILPSGQQTVFSRVHGASATAAGASHNRVFQNNQQTTGPADIAHDDGFSTWIGCSPHGYLDMQLGFTRSAQYDLNTVSFTVGVNWGRLAHRGARH
jgi:hypothetical protein